MKNKRLVLVDANSLLHRAFHAMPPLTAPSGELVGAVYGFSSLLLRVINELKPDYVAVAWDVKAPTFRHQKFAEYKGNRKETPSELIEQLDKARKVVDAFDIPQYSISGYEADDVIGTLAYKANQQSSDLEVVIVTGDMDMLQLVNEKTKVFAPKKSFADPILYGIDEVKNKFGGLGPEQVVDYKALRGDPSDNIPGVKGIGEKSAINLLNQYIDLEGVYQHLEEVAARQQNLLKDGHDICLLSRELAQIAMGAPIDLDLDSKNFRTMDPSRVREVFRDYGFKSLVGKIPDVYSNDENRDEMPVTQILEDAEIEKLQFEEVDPDVFDIQLAEHLLTGESDKQLQISRLIFNYFGIAVDEKDLSEKQIKYYSSLLREEIENKIDLPENGQVRTLFYELEMPLKQVLREMERVGVLVDQALMKELSEILESTIQKLEEGAYEEIGHEVNLNSPKQLAEVLFDELRLPVLKKTKTQRSTREEVLWQLKELHPFVETLLKYREAYKLKSTYIDPLPEYLADDGRVHTTYNQTKVASGRLSSENPNMQNIPTDTDTGIRRLFIASPGMKMIAADYSQFELRIMAHITDDKNLLSAFNSREDIHAATASRIFEKEVAVVSSEERKVGKTINFALMYGMGPHGLAQSLKIGVTEAKDYIERFLGKYPKVAEWKEQHLEKVREKGYVETMYGRRRPLVAINSSNFHQRAAAERIAINHPLQGTQADLMKMAMLRVDREIKQRGLADVLIMLIQVHDELVFEVKEEKLDKAMELIKAEMEGAIELKVPVDVHIGVGDNWQEAK